MQFSLMKSGFLALAVLLVFSIPNSKTQAQEEDISPDSEYVHKMIRPAVAFLKGHVKIGKDYGDPALVGLAIYNAGLRLGQQPDEIKSDPVMIKILDKVSKSILEITPESERTIYSACVAGLLLAEVDADKYHQQIDHILNFLYARQLNFGAWGYFKETRGDTSQTQYGALFLWLAKTKKFKVKASVVENAIKFLVVTQTGSGGFVYKAEPGNPIGSVTNSLTAAGMGSLYLLGDAYGLHGGQDPGAKKRSPFEANLPPSVTLVVEGGDEKKDEIKGPVRQIAGFGAAKAKGDAWLRQNWTVNPATWTYYYLYGYERYQSFKERAENRTTVAPPWYVQGAKFLQQNQGGDGSWISSNAVEASREHATSFAVLFLVRSTQLLLPTPVDILVVGGSGLPDEGPLEMRGGRLVNQTFAKDFGDVMALIETGSDTDWLKFEREFDALVLDANKGSRAQQMATLRKMVSEKNPVARKVAVKSLGKNRSFENVPFLIHALSDPEPEIAILANDGLKFISRKFSAQKLSTKPTKQEIVATVKRWSDWYLAVVPDGRLLEVE